MRALVQRVTEANVSVAGEVVGKIGPGLLILACAMAGDDEKIARKLAAKIAKLRIFPDEQGRMNRSLIDVSGQALLVSQFTLAADTSRGNRPGFSTAAPPEQGRTLLDHFGDALRRAGVTVETGVFGADMAVSLINDGPVTIWFDTSE